MTSLNDGPASPRFRAIPIQGNIPFEQLSTAPGLTPDMARLSEYAPRGESVAWGLPFQVADPILLQESPVTVTFPAQRAGWLVFMHAVDARQDDFVVPRTAAEAAAGFRGQGRLNELAAYYVMLYADGSEERVEIRCRQQVGLFRRAWGENCFQCVPMHKPIPVRPHHEQMQASWGFSQTRAFTNDEYDWMNWLYAWENPHPEKPVSGLRFEPVNCAGVGHALVISGVSAGEAAGVPTRWRTRRKALLRLPENFTFQPDVDANGLLAQIRLDLGTVISAAPRTVYPQADWAESYNNQLPRVARDELIVEYAAHAQASFHLWDGRVVPAAEIEQRELYRGAALSQPACLPVAPATQRVTLKVIDKHTGQRVAVKLHVHGAAGEYLAANNRSRIVNPAWFEDYSVDFAHRNIHQSSYISGETQINLPLGPVYVEIAKGFEIRPVRRVLEIGPDTGEVVIEVERVLPWRERGWVTADTHVHFLSPGSAMLEGAGEGVNVVNLLASQWGELMTNVGDFDGKTTWGAGDTGGGPEDNGEYLVRVGTENRQHVMGHISLLGYTGAMITPMTTGGPDESALGDPVEVLLTEWARQCKAQGGVVILPHFPEPRAEHAASIVAGVIDGIEMTSWEDLYSGINPYALADWYRYLNCGYRVAAVGGTDKMGASTAVGTVRTYAHLRPDQPFAYDAWMDAVRRAETFVTYGPLLDFAVDGQPCGSRITLPRTGGALDVTWQVASVTVPCTRVELMVNGVVRESAALSPEGGAGSWSVPVDQSCWLALLVRGHYPDQAEIVAAHSSPVMVSVEGSELLAAADGVTILEQIEGAMAYLDTVGTRAEDRVYKRMRLALEDAHRILHNRMHEMGFFHQHGRV